VAALVSFLLMYYLNIPSNIMSLSGIAISLGILVDAAVVMVENATHELYLHFGHQPVRGDTTEIIVKACRLVGRPIFFSVLIMLISFLPVFAFGGQEGKLSGIVAGAVHGRAGPRPGPGIFRLVTPAHRRTQEIGRAHV